MTLISCVHSPIISDDEGTGDPVNTPCDTTVIYFESDVLPILTTNCAYSGCHNAASAKDGVVLDNYANVIKTGDVKPYDAGNSDLYKVLTKKDPKKVMPPPPSKLLPSDINIILKWIQQGAKNIKCDNIGCNTANMSFSKDIKPIINGCVVCHNVGNALGGVRLDTYDHIKTVASNGKLIGSLSWAPGFKAMPQGGNKIASCSIEKIQSWINAGALNN